MIARSYRRVLDRRTFLRGAGTVTVALPFLDSMICKSVFAQAPAEPERLITSFFQLGVMPYHTGGVNQAHFGAMAQHQAGLTVLTGINLSEGDTSEQNHFDGGSSCFTANRPNSGPSLEQAVKKALHPTGMPPGVLDTVVYSTYFRRTREGNDAPTRYVHSWNESGGIVMNPRTTPGPLFDFLFGSAPALSSGGTASRGSRSVFDTMDGEWKRWTSEAGNLPAADRAKLNEYYDAVRQHENEAFAPGMNCAVPAMPGSENLVGSQNPDATPTMDPNAWKRSWRTAVDLFVLGLACDRFRFGNISLGSAGERVRFNRSYTFEDGTSYNFNDGQAHHEWWHQRNETMSRHHLHFTMDNLAYLLQKLKDARGPSGKNLFESTLTVFGTENGDGAAHSLTNVWHAVAGGKGRVRLGQVITNGASATNLYTKLAKAVGANRTVGRGDPNNGNLSGLLP